MVTAVALVVINLTVARLPEMPPADGKYISLHGKEIHYFEQPGQGVPVVMIHGEPGSHQDFAPVVAKLPGLHLISIDRPGFGWSAGVAALSGADRRCPRVTNRAQARSSGSRRALVWRQLALGVARRYPQDVARLILVAPAAGGSGSRTMTSSAGPLHPVQSLAGGTHDHRRHRG